MSDLYKKVEEYVKKSYTVDGITSTTFDHQVETAKIVKEIDPNACEELVIAALSHDIERAFRKTDMLEILKSDKLGFKSTKFLKLHQERSAEIMKDFCLQNKTSINFANKVAELISQHEVGGTKEGDLLKDADSLSFFSSRALHFVEKKIGISSKEKVRLKLDWMFERITSENVKVLAKPMYEEALKLINSTS